MRLKRNYYEVMGLPPSATPDEVRERFFELARKFHPDRAKDKKTSERLFAQINIAYRTLRDPGRRGQYNQTIGQSSSPKAQDEASPRQFVYKPAQQVESQAAPPLPSVRSQAEGMQLAMKAQLAGESAKARQFCQAALAFDPANSETHQLIGDTHEAQGSHTEALEAYRKALETRSSSTLLKEKIRRCEAAIQVEAKRLAAQPPVDKPKTSSRPPTHQKPTAVKSLLTKIGGRGK